MPIRLKKVDGCCERYAALLSWLQLEVLPGDRPTETDEGHWWIAFDGGSPVAFGGLYASEQDPEGGYLCRSGVLPHARGQRLQQRLLKAREGYARKLGMKTLYTDTYDNPHSTNNMIAAGYRAFSPAVRYGITGATYWRKTL